VFSLRADPSGGVYVPSTTCKHDNPANANAVFCVECGKIIDLEGLRSIRLAGAIGVRHSSNPKIERFWQTGDPTGL
jgi:hypothetical protein